MRFLLGILYPKLFVVIHGQHHITTRSPSLEAKGKRARQRQTNTADRQTERASLACSLWGCIVRRRGRSGEYDYAGPPGGAFLPSCIQKRSAKWQEQ